MDVENLNSTQSTEVSSSLPCSTVPDQDQNPSKEEAPPVKSPENSSRPTTPIANSEGSAEEEEETGIPEDPETVISSSENSSDSPEQCDNGTLSPSESVRLTQSILDAKKLVDSISHCLSRAEKVCGAEDKMVQGNGVALFANQGSVPSENLARYFAMPSVNKNMNVALALGNSFNLKYPTISARKENAFQSEYNCENRNSEHHNSDEDEDFEINEDEENEDWSFDEDEEAIRPGKQCACEFKHAGNENGSKTPLKRQNSNQDSPSTSQLQSNPFFLAPNILPCPDCDQSFSCRVDLNRHRLKHITEKSFKCSRCDKSFAFSFNLKSHERQHTGEKPYVCGECGLSFVHAFSFHEHRRVHDSRSHLVCSICLKWYNSEAKYLLHIRRHSSIKPFKCSICGKAFHRAAGLRAHELLHSVQKEDQQYSCRFCDRTFVRLSHKQMHERVHFSEKLFPCLCCGKTFNDLGQLKTHDCSQASPLHQFKCDICKDVFPSLLLFESHSRTHIGKKSTGRGAQLPESKFGIFKRRAAIGSAKKRFPCKLCSQTFSTKRLLEDHGKIHQQEYTPFVCKVCSLTFTHSNYLKLHLTTHEENSLSSAPSQNLSVANPHERIHLKMNVLPQGVDLGYESPSSVRSRQSSGEHSACSSPLNKSPPVRIKSEPE